MVVKLRFRIDTMPLTTLQLRLHPVTYDSLTSALFLAAKAAPKKNKKNGKKVVDYFQLYAIIYTYS